MPVRTDSLLDRLEAVRRLRPGARAAARALRESAGLRLSDPRRLIRLHEAVLFLRAYPHSPRVLQLAESVLAAFGKRVARLAADGVDMSPFDEPEVAGIVGTEIGTDFSFPLARWLASRFPGSVRSAWAAAELGDRMRATWPYFLPLLDEEALADANVAYLAWLGAAAGSRRDDLGWLLRRYERLPFSEGTREERFDSLGLPIAWNLGDSRASRASRTAMRRPGPAHHFHDAPFLARRDVSLDAALAGPRLALRRLPRREAERVCDMVRTATAARYRELYQFTFADPASVMAARPGRGVEVFLVGVRPERRLPLRAAYGGFIVKNGVPIGYTEGLAFADRLEIGFNMYYTFREGESAWLYAQMLRLHHGVLGVTSFSVDPYQIGFENEEAIDSGAFWFYRKLGFRPTHPSVTRVLGVEERRLAADSSRRSSPATLRRLVTHNLIWDAPGAPSGDWDRFHIRNLGLAVNRAMARSFGGSADAIREASERRVARALGLSLRRLPPLARRAFESFALVLDLIPDLPRWPREDRGAIAAIVHAKASGPERRYLRLLQSHPRLRRALIRLGAGR